MAMKTETRPVHPDTLPVSTHCHYVHMECHQDWRIFALTICGLDVPWEGYTPNSLLPRCEGCVAKPQVCPICYLGWT